MLKEALQYIASLGQQAADRKERKIAAMPDGRYCFTDTGDVITPVLPTPLQFGTLAGFASYVAANRDDLLLDKLAAHVVSASRVLLIDALHVAHCKRAELACAVPPLQTRHHFGSYLDGESMVIWLLSGFVQDESTAAVLRVIGNLQGEKVTTVVDDGVTQMAAVRAGVSRAKEVEIKNPVWLRPYRTFDEVEQPASPFILRLHEQNGGAPKAALFESSDTTWCGQAMKFIAEKLRAELEQRGVTNVPVLA